MYGLLLTSDLKEPITKFLLRHQNELNFPLILLPIQNLLNTVNIFDEIKDGIAKIGWLFSDGKYITNSNDYFLINRVLSVPDSLFEDFHPIDKNYAQAEFRAYLTFAIQAFPRATAKPGPGGLAGNRFSLPQQWKIVQKSQINIHTPLYYLGNPHYHPFTNVVSVVQSTIFNYYYWKPGVPSCHENDVNFCFVRPEGIPVISSIIGSQIKVFSYSSDCSLSELAVRKLTEISKKLAEVFDYFIAECLLFLNDDKITFGMITNIPYVSTKESFFSSAVITACNEIVSHEAFCES